MLLQKPATTPHVLVGVETVNNQTATSPLSIFFLSIMLISLLGQIDSELIQRRT